MAARKKLELELNEGNLAELRKNVCINYVAKTTNDCVTSCNGRNSGVCVSFNNPRALGVEIVLTPAKHVDRGIYNISYLGLEDVFIYIGTQEGIRTIDSFDLFTGWHHGHTISRKKINEILSGVPETDNRTLKCDEVYIK